MSLLTHPLREKDCQILEEKTLKEVVESIDTFYELKTLSAKFQKFLKNNIGELAKIILFSKNLVSRKIIQIITTDNSVIRRILTFDDHFLEVICEFPKHCESSADGTYYAAIYSQILYQLVLHNEFDFLGRIYEAEEFMRSLLCISHFMAIEQFLIDFLESTNISVTKFFVRSHTANLLIEAFSKDNSNVEILLGLISTFANALEDDSCLIDTILQEPFIINLISFARTTTYTNAAAIAFEFIAINYANERLPSESSKAVKNQMIPLCRYITIKASQHFDSYIRCAVDLLIAIINATFSDSEYTSSNEDNYEEEEEVKKVTKPMFVPLQGKQIVRARSNSIMKSEAIIKPVEKSAGESPKISVIPRIPSKNANNIPKPLKPMHLSPERQKSVQIVSTPDISNKFELRNSQPSVLMREAKADFSLMSLVQSSPVFTGLFTIEEEADSPLLPNTMPLNTIKKKSKKSSMEDPIVEVAVALLHAFFSKPYCSLLHRTVLDLLEELSEKTDLLPIIFNDVDFADEVYKNKDNVANLGYIHEICRLLRDSENEKLSDLADQIDPEWIEKEDLYNYIEDLPKRPKTPEKLASESNKVWGKI